MENRKSLRVMFVIVLLSFLISVLAMCKVNVRVDTAEEELDTIVRYVNDNIYICPECGSGLTEESDYYSNSAYGQLICYTCGWKGRKFENEGYELSGTQAVADGCLEKAKQSYLDAYGTPAEVLKRIGKREDK